MPREERLSNLALAVLAGSILTAVMSASMTNVALPDLKDDFGIGADTLSWVVTAYILTFATGTVVYGRLADMAGVKPLFAFGFGLFAVSSLVIAVMPWYWGLVAARAVQGIGGTAVPALTMATIVRTTPPGERGAKMGVITLAVGFGFGIGPLLGGVLTDVGSWRTPFLVTALSAAVLLPVVWRLVPSPPGMGRQSLDVAGGALLIAMVAGVVIALNRLPRGAGDLFGWSGLVLAVPAFVGFTLRERMAREPFVNTELLRRARFLGLSVVGMATQGSHFGLVFLLPLLLQEYHDLSIMEIGFVLLPGAMSIAVFGAVGGRITQRFGTTPAIVGGGAVLASATVLFASSGVAGEPWQIALLYVWLAAGYGVMNASIVPAATAELPDRLAGLGTGVYNLFFFLGGAVSVALAGALVRSRAGAEAWNPFHRGDAGEFSDAMLVVVAMATIGLVLAIAATWGRSVVPDRESLDIGPGVTPEGLPRG